MDDLTLRRRLTRQHRALQQRRRLAPHPLFAACSRQELRTIVRWGDEFEVPEGVDLLRENGLGNCFVVVLSGRVALTRAGRQIGTVGAGGWVGEVAVLGFGPQPATATTASRCRLFAMGPRALLSFAATLPGLRHGLFPGLSEREANERIRELRAEGLPQWRRLRVPVPKDAGPRPEWLRAYPARQRRSTVPHHIGTPPRASRIDDVRHRRAHPVRQALAVILFVAIGVGALGVTLPVPYFTERGAVRSATGLVHISGTAVYPPRGQIIFPVVDLHHDTAFDAVSDWFDHRAVLLRGDEVPDGPTAADLDRANVRMMSASKRVAVAVALEHVGTDTVAPDVEIDTGTLGGPSGGMAFALAILDLLSPGELTGARTIAATGTIAPDGTIGAVGGVRLKTLAARAAGADLFLVPRANEDEARANAGAMRVVAVDTLDDALRTLSSME